MKGADPTFRLVGLVWFKVGLWLVLGRLGVCLGLSRLGVGRFRFGFGRWV